MDDDGHDEAYRFPAWWVLARVMSRMETNDMSSWGGGGTRGSEARQSSRLRNDDDVSTQEAFQVRTSGSDRLRCRSAEELVDAMTAAVMRGGQKVLLSAWFAVH